MSYLHTVVVAREAEFSVIIWTNDINKDIYICIQMVEYGVFEVMAACKVFKERKEDTCEKHGSINTHTWK